MFPKLYKVKTPDGTMMNIEGPEGASEAEVIAKAQELGNYWNKQAGIIFPGLAVDFDRTMPKVEVHGNDGEVLAVGIELDDSKASINPVGLKHMDDKPTWKHFKDWALKKNASLNLEDILVHDKLYKAYPWLKKLKVKVVPEDNTILGYFDEGDNTASDKIAVNKERMDDFVSGRRDLKTTLLHEVVHQAIMERFRRDPKMKKIPGVNFYENYLPSTAEIVPRVMEKRENMTSQERRDNPVLQDKLDYFNERLELLKDGALDGYLESDERIKKEIAKQKSKQDMTTSNIDWNFISQQEGTKLEGYVPDSKNSKSGVTIATGFDLGQRKEVDIEMLPKDLQNKLKPYLGLTKEKAVEKLKEIPLNITKEEQKIIDENAKSQAVQYLIKDYEKETGKRFSDLTRQQQTVIASVAFQYGNLADRTPNFWKAVTNNDWDTVEKELRNFKDRYPSRRNREADYLVSK